MRESLDVAPAVRYRCRACGREFVVAAPGAAPCPRCQSIASHEERGPTSPEGPDGVE